MCTLFTLINNKVQPKMSRHKIMQTLHYSVLGELQHTIQCFGDHLSATLQATL